MRHSRQPFMRRPLTRRRFLAAAPSATLLPPALLPAVASAQLLSDPDVVVVGAGAAGLAAARALIAAGKSVVVVEAADRIGGRAWTESETFGVPFDHGCSWITSGDVNPFKAMGDDAGFDLRHHSNADEALYVGGRQANDKEWGQYDRAWSAVNRALAQAGEKGTDVAAATLMPRDMPFVGVSETWIGPMDMGVDFKDLSTRDFWEGADTDPNYRVREGFGTLVTHLGDGLPIRLNAAVTRVAWGGPGVSGGVSVETTAGTLRAKACILTVSTGVLAAGAIAFAPALPDWKQQAVDDLPMGLLAKVALQFDGARLGLAPDDWLIHWVPNEVPAEACYFLTWPFDFDIMIGFFGGEFGWELSAAGPDAAIDFALGQLTAMLGSDAKGRFVKGAMTGWAADPLTLGAYAAARPGRYDARAELARPLADRLFFAGEALAGPYTATAGGAYLSGEEVGQKVAAVIG